MSKQVLLRNPPEAPLSKEAILDATIAFANGCELHMEGWKPKPAEVLELERGFIRDWLARIRKGESAAIAREWARQNWRGWSPGHITRVMRPTRTGLSLRYHEAVFTAYGLALRGIARLLASSEARDRLCQCQYSKCGDYFWKQQPRKGRPRDTYCSDEHKKLGNSEQAAGRMKSARSTT